MGTNKLKLKFKNLIDAYIATTKRFSYAILLAALAAIVMIVFVHLEDTLSTVQQDWFARAAMVLFLGVPFALSIKVILELMDNNSKLFILGLRLVALILLVLYFFFGLPVFNSTHIIRYVGFMLFLWGMFLVLPFIKGKALVEIYTFKVLWRLLITAFYCGIIFGGVSGILFSLKELLNVAIIEEHYLDALLVVAGIILPSFFFAGIPKKDEALPESNTKFFRILLIYVLMPILTAYTVVLYSYFVKMLIDQTLPKNIIGNLVLWYSIVSILVLYLSKQENNKNKWATLFDRWLPRLMLIPIGMLFTAIILRIKQYGVTEPRYFTVIGGLWVLAMACYLIIKPPTKRLNAIIPITASLLAILTVIGPWSAFSVSKLNQNQRLEALLMDNNMVKNGQLVANADIDNETKTQISAKILYFNKAHTLDDIDAFAKQDSIESIEKDIGFTLNEWSYLEKDFAYYRLSEDDFAFDILDYDLLFTPRGKTLTYQTSGGEIKIIGRYEDNDAPSERIIVHYNNTPVLSKSIADYGEELYNKYHENNELSQKEMTFVHDTEDLRITIVFLSIEVERNSDGENTDKHRGWAEYVILIELKD